MGVVPASETGSRPAESRCTSRQAEEAQARLLQGHRSSEVERRQKEEEAQDRGGFGFLEVFMVFASFRGSFWVGFGGVWLGGGMFLGAPGSWPCGALAVLQELRRSTASALRAAELHADAAGVEGARREALAREGADWAREQGVAWPRWQWGSGEWIVVIDCLMEGL